MLISLCFTAFGYLCGSILFARVYGALFGKDLISNSTDGNPGTSNAFIYGGMLCGTLTLLGDLIKGFLPVFLYLYMTRGNMDIYLAPVLVSPVLGHILPCFYRFRGGKGIAVGVGSLLGFAWPVGLIELGIFFVIAYATKRVSAGSVTVAAIVGLVLALFYGPNLGQDLIVEAAGLVVVWAHRSNIKKLVSGQEKPFSFPKKGERPMPDDPSVGGSR